MELNPNPDTLSYSVHLIVKLQHKYKVPLRACLKVINIQTVVQNSYIKFFNSLVKQTIYELEHGYVKSQVTTQSNKTKPQEFLLLYPYSGTKEHQT